jgi:hypothetical protein
VGQARIERGTEQAQRRIEIKHGLERADLADPRRDQQIGHARRQRASRDRQRADQAIARKDIRPFPIRGLLGKRGLLERHMYADVSGRRVDGAEKSDHSNERHMLEARDRNPGRNHQQRAEQEQRAQLVARRQEPDRQGQCRRPEQRRRRHQSDLERVEPDLEQIGRQDDGGEAIAETSRRARCV